MVFTWRPQDVQQADTNITDTADDTLVAAPGAGRQIYLLGLYVTNEHETVGTVVALKQSGTKLFGHWAQAAGGGFGFEYRGIPWGENNSLEAANETNGSDTHVQIEYVIGPV